MLKIEYIWREILYQGVELKNPDFTITELSMRFKLSTSMVSHALLPLRELGMVRIGKIKSSLIDAERLLFFWATRRNLNKDIIYKTRSELSVFEREAFMPRAVLPTAYSACRLYFDLVPSDYENIYFYADNEGEVSERFPENTKKFPNIFILKADNYLKMYKKVPKVQIFADLWNLPEWYAKEFYDKLLLDIKTDLGI